MLALGVLAIVGLLLANGFFVLAEFAVITVDRTRVEELARAGDRRAGRLLTATTQLTRHLSAAQFGVTLSTIAEFLNCSLKCLKACCLDS